MNFAFVYKRGTCTCGAKRRKEVARAGAAMKQTLILSTALSAILAQGAFAADLPTKKGPPPAPAVAAPFSWPGFYLGGNLGYVFDPDRVYDLSGQYGHLFNGGSDTLNPSGIVGGLQAGYNYQIQNFVLGVEGDLDWTGATQSRSGVLGGGETLGQPVHSTSLPFFADLRARLGYAFDRLLPYVTGGVVVADINNHLSDTGPEYEVDTPFSLGRSSAVGWVIGAGLEYAIDAHWSVKAEYLFMQFPDVTRNYESYAFKFTDSAQLARLGVNYRF